MMLKDFITKLSEYPDDLDLTEIKINLSVEKVSGQNRIQSAYLADHRIAGEHPWGRLSHMERQTNLHEVAQAILTGLKLYS